MRNTARLKVGFELVFVSVCGAGCGGPQPVQSEEPSGSPANPPVPVYLEQGWSRGQAEDFYYTTQGAQVIPFTWFIAREQADSTALFRDEGNLARLGFISQPPHPQKNPY